MSEERSFIKDIKERYRDSLAKPVQNELENHLLPFWLSIRTKADGASAGLVDTEGRVHEDAPRSLIYTSRMLWTFAELCLAGYGDEVRDAAKAEFDLLQRKFRDEEHGGYFHLVSPDGHVKDDMKLLYAQGFVLYALSAWYRASGEKNVLSMAKELFALIEVGCRIYYDDVPAYGEVYTRNFEPGQSNILSTHGDEAIVTMNTVLHLIEAYTALYQAWPNPHVKTALIDLLYFYKQYIYNPNEKRLNVFLDSQLEASSDIWSFGHDIEAAWLVEFAVDTIEKGKAELSAEENALLLQVREISRMLEDSVLAEALETVDLPSGRSGLVHINERFENKDDRTRVWWVQAEALSALVNAGVKREDESYFEKAEALWRSIEELISDRRENGEWYEELDEHNLPRKKDRAHAWKAFYHNGRTCINLLRFFGLAEGSFPQA